MAKRFFTSDLETAGTLDVDGVTTLNGDLDVNSNTDIGGTLDVTGNTGLAGTLGVTGATTLASAAVTGAATVGTTLDVTGNYTSTNGNISLTNGGITTGGASTVQSLGVVGAATVGTTLDVTGMTSLDGGLTIDELTISSTGVLNTGDNGIALGDGNLSANAGSFMTSSGNITTNTGYVKSPKIQNVSDLTLVCDSGGAESTSKIKFCKDETTIELASIDQAGTLSLGVNAGSNYAKIQSTRVPGNNIEFLASGSSNLFINSSSDVVIAAGNSNKVQIQSDLELDVNDSVTTNVLKFPGTGNTWCEHSSSNGNVDITIDSAGNTSSDGSRFRILDKTSSGVRDLLSVYEDKSVQLYGDLYFSTSSLPEDYDVEDALNLDVDNRLLINTSNGKVVKGTDDFFSEGHFYWSENNILPGLAVCIADGVLTTSPTSNSTVCVGIVALALEVTADSRHKKDSLGVSRESGYLHKVISLGDSRYKQCNGFKVCNEGGALQPGDLLVTSSTPGYLMRQSDDIMRSKTVGKCMQAVTFDENGQAVDVYGYIYCG